MRKEENVIEGSEQVHEEKPDEQNDGGLKIKTNVKAGQGGDDVIIIKGG